MSPNSADTGNVIGGNIKLYKRRWLIMGVFLWYTITCGMQWIEFGGINNIISRYYQVPPTHVEWTTLVYNVGYVLFVFPSLYVMDHFGIRVAIIIASAGTCVGACIKVLSVAPDRFYILMIGQSLEALFTVFTFGASGRFTAIWFGRKEISRAGALALFGDQLGGCLGYLLPAALVDDTSDSQLLEEEMYRLHVTVAMGSVITLLLVVLFFEEKPERPPSIAEARQKELQSENIRKSMIRIFTTPSFLCITMSYSLAVATSGSLNILLNQLISINFPHSRASGLIGTSFMISGMLSTLITSNILDRTGKFKESAVILAAGASISIAFLTVALKSNNILYVYLAAILVGFFLQGYYGTGIQMGIEVTYPIPENITIATMFLFVQFVSTGLTTVYGYAVKEYGDFISNVGMVLVMMTSSILASLIPPNLKRQNVENERTGVEIQDMLPQT